MRLRDPLSGLQVRDSSGASKPILAREQVLYESQTHHERASPPRLWLPYLIVGVLLVVFVTLAPNGIMGWVDAWRRRRKR